MLELARGVGLGVDVRDLLELQRAFHRDRPHRAAPQEQRVVLLGEVLGEQAQHVVHREHLLDCGGRVIESREQLGLALRGEPAVTAEHQRDEQQREQLRRERLGARDADLGSGLRHHHEVGLAHH